MSTEITDTMEGLRAGKYTFTVAAIPEKKQFTKSGKWYYDFTLETECGQSLLTHQEKIPVWLSAPILRAIGAKEVEEGKFEWDREKVVGIQFDAEVEMQKSGDKIFPHITNPIAIKQPVSDEKVPF